MAQETLFKKVQQYFKRNRDATPLDIFTAVGCTYHTAVAYSNIIRQGFSSPAEYHNALKQRKKQPKRDEFDSLFDNLFDTFPTLLESLPQIETPAPVTPLVKTTESTSSSLPPNGGQGYHRVQAKIQKVLLKSILTEAENNPSHVISLSDIGRRASLHPAYIHFNEEYIPALLEKYVHDGVLDQEFVTLNSGRIQPMYVINKIQKEGIEGIILSSKNENKTKPILTAEQKHVRNRAIILQAFFEQIQTHPSEPSSEPIKVTAYAIQEHLRTHPPYVPFTVNYIKDIMRDHALASRLTCEQVYLEHPKRNEPLYFLTPFEQQNIEKIIARLHQQSTPQPQPTPPPIVYNRKNLTLRDNDMLALFHLGLTAQDIATEVGIEKVKIEHIVRQQGSFFKKGRGATYVETIKQLLVEDNLIDIYRRFNFPSPFGFWDYCTRHKISIPEHLTPIPFDQTIDTLIEQGKSITEIGASQNKTREWARQYIMGGGWYNVWQQKRTEQTQKYQIAQERQTHQTLLALLSHRMTQLAEKDSWSTQKAVEYFIQLDKRRHQVKPFSFYLTLFQEYESAQQQGEQITLQELAQISGFAHPAAISHIFKKVNLEPMFGNSLRSPTHKLEALDRGIALGLGSSDMAYFLDLPKNNIHAYFSTRDIPSYPTSFVTVSYTDKNYNKKENNVPFSITSEIYEAADAGFALEEIQPLIKCKRKGGSCYDISAIQELLTSRAEIEPILITLLQQLYNKPDLDKPYKIPF